MRKTSSDYRKELNKFRKEVESTEAHIKDRLIQLIEKFPEAIVVKKGVDEFKAKYITKSWIDGLTPDEQIEYISEIEKYTESLERVRQISIYDEIN